ncbi:amidase [Rathayibacter rathayi]|uniref:Amidase n=1 Tax=Rathayibacter rathayi TaxID=33887 RepID=A0ABX5AFI3_RATRA|nr:amidase [Rathayibacter rathayi]AZZ48351.1 amidase [Rathayibacter rathayi]MWV74252.1 amidase [Rathayibacter rathayi NCPPB 2980 = VKM Ac-1601]PPF49338.1 amidase [Rathayibacter rathayi]PPF81856.1 amidase [Rathayibacter rathayi]PPG13510.1 amidase [Rathayibacter rathayi]
MFELHHLSAQEQWDWLQRGDITSVELTEHYLTRIERWNDELGAFATVTAERARERASALGPAPGTAPLWGLPSGDKDLWRRAGVRTAFGSRLREHDVPTVSDEIVEVLDAAGTVSLGKTAAPEFGMPAYTETRIGPPAVTPWDTRLGAGGSSGGAAVAVAAGLLPFAPASDGGGSIRIPAAACGLVGLKPSRGRVAALSGIGGVGGLSVAGPIARSVADAGLLLEGMLERRNGRLPQRWSLGAPGDGEGSFLGAAVRGEGRFQIGVLTDSPWDDAYEIRLAPEARAALDEGIAALAALGHGLEQASLPPSADYPAAFRMLWQSGAATLPVEGADLDLLEPLTRWLVEEGRRRSARDLVEAASWLSGYERAVIAAFSAFDAVLTPSMAMTPRPVGWYDLEDPERNFEQQCLYTPYTSFVNVSGLPAITLPLSTTEEGLPMGIQLIGRPGGEATLLAIGTQLERRARWQRRHPPQW